MIKSIVLPIFCWALWAVSGFTQPDQARLANQYFNQGEYEKAAVLYLKVWKAQPKQESIYDRYIESLLQSEQYKEAHESIDTRIKQSPSNVALLVKKAKVLKQEGYPEEANKIYEEAIEGLSADNKAITNLGQALHKERLYLLSLQAYERGATLLNDTLRFANQMRNLSIYANDKERIIQYSLMLLSKHDQMLDHTKTQFQRSLTVEDQPALQAKIYEFIQTYPQKIAFPELLQWSFVQLRDFPSALRQARALDRRLDENGHRVFELAQMANNHEEHKIAIDAYDYLIQNKSENTRIHLSARSEKLRSKKQLIIKQGGSQEELESLEQEYHNFFSAYGADPSTAYIWLDLARFQNQYMHDTDKAIETLNKLVDMPGVNEQVLAHGKLLLGDLYLLQGDRWESTLLYSQVDKDFPEGELGETARYRNAMLSYYVGEFEWAQEQFDILKAATTKLISNDAIDRSVFILDNLGLDTTAIPLMAYANAELKIYQRYYDDAFVQLDQLITDYPEHGLLDDIYYLKANAHMQQKEYDLAARLYGIIAADYSDDIRADNSMYALAELYAGVFNDELTAARIYEKLFIEFTDSTFAVDARKRYRDIVDRQGSDQIEALGLTPEEAFMRGKRLN